MSRLAGLATVIVAMVWSVAALACACPHPPFDTLIARNDDEAWRAGEQLRKWLIATAGDRYRRDTTEDQLYIATVWRQELVDDPEAPPGSIRSYIHVQEVWRGPPVTEIVLISSMAGGGRVPYSCTWRIQLGTYRPLVLLRNADGSFQLAGICDQVLAEQILENGLLRTLTGRQEPIVRHAP